MASVISVRLFFIGVGMSDRQGFSLIELLVVVAIIGILASVGFVSYQAYINSTKSDVVKSQDNEFGRYLQQTELILDGGITASDWIESDPNTKTRCDVFVAALVQKMNADLSNPFNKLIPAYKDGHTDPAYPGQQQVEGGQTLVFCINPTVSMLNTAIITCANTSADAAATTGNVTHVSNWDDKNLDSEVSADEIIQGRCPTPGTG